MASPAPRTMPRLLKATYLADQEGLLEETRATALYYLPRPIVWLLLFGILTYLTEAARHGWPGNLPAYAAGLSSFAGAIHADVATLERYFFYVFALLELVGLAWLLVRYLRWISTVYAVTSRRVIVQKGILGRDFDEIPVLQVRGIDVHQSFGERLLGYGSIRVSSEGGNRIGNEDWKGIPRPFKFQKLIEGAVANLQQPAGPVAWAPPVARR